MELVLTRLSWPVGWERVVVERWRSESRDPERWELVRFRVAAAPSARPLGTPLSEDIGICTGRETSNVCKALARDCLFRNWALSCTSYLCNLAPPVAHIHPDILKDIMVVSQRHLIIRLVLC